MKSPVSPRTPTMALSCCQSQTAAEPPLTMPSARVSVDSGVSESPGPFGFSSELLDLQSTRWQCDGSGKCGRRIFTHRSASQRLQGKARTSRSRRSASTAFRRLTLELTGDRRSSPLSRFLTVGPRRSPRFSKRSILISNRNPPVRYSPLEQLSTFLKTPNFPEARGQESGGNRFFSVPEFLFRVHIPSSH